MPGSTDAVRPANHHSDPPMLLVEGLRKRYGGVAAVDGISFTVGRGEVFGILGPNGAGKTTTLEMIETLRPIDEGNVRIAGKDVRSEPQTIKTLIGVQLQTSSFFDRLTVREIIRLFAAFYGRTVDAAAILREVDLEEKADAYPQRLSGGQAQRLSVAVALVNDPLLLFLDEPTTGLDPQARRHLWGVLQRIRAEGTTIVLTTHSMEEAEELCDRVAIMDRGRIIALDTPASLIGALVSEGFSRQRANVHANLEDVFLALTGHSLRDDA